MGSKIMIKILYKLILFTVLSVISAEAYASIVDLECSYHRSYFSNVIKKSKEYVKNHSSENDAYYEAKFNIEESRNNEEFHEKFSIDLINKKIIGDLGSYIIMNDIAPKIEEFSDKLFIDYFSPSNKPIETLIINRNTGALLGVRYVSASSLEPIFHLGEKNYYISGQCHLTKMKRIF